MPERKLEFQKFSDKLETGLLIKAPSYERLFIDAALTLTAFRTDIQIVKEEGIHKLDLQAGNLKDLFTQWIDENVKLSEINHFLARRIVFDRFDAVSIHATLTGEKYDGVKHGFVSPIEKFHHDSVEIGEEALQTTPSTVAAANDNPSTFFAKFLLRVG